ncbi:hypothetical protein ACUH7Y_25440 [Clostridium beijerinckii]|uniref:Uncharacterized protein n=1 Tax=Clostridium beijerinckii TaxID=1520 RepID=A0A7X9SR62_CLOBE|nr:hypothetical protein [Clostridium beijerinckii]NMF06576.1 hypothetical protein [Clostridium beijerinckii]
MEDKIMKVKCIYNRNGHYHVTVGKEYTIEGFALKGYMILNDDNEITLYPKSLFEKIIYTVIEIFDEPVGTEFNVRYLDGSLGNKKVKTALGECIVWEDGEPVEFNKDHIKAVFIRVEETKPVSFMDVLNSDMKCRVEHLKVDESLTNTEIIFSEHTIDKSFAAMQKGEYIDFADVMLVLTRHLGNEYLKQAIKEGKWYLKG